jgi:hypothetical protein
MIGAVEQRVVQGGEKQEACLLAVSSMSEHGQDRRLLGHDPAEFPVERRGSEDLCRLLEVRCQLIDLCVHAPASVRTLRHLTMPDGQSDERPLPVRGKTVTTSVIAPRRPARTER